MARNGKFVCAVDTNGKEVNIIAASVSLKIRLNMALLLAGDYVQRKLYFPQEQTTCYTRTR